MFSKICKMICSLFLTSTILVAAPAATPLPSSKIKLAEDVSASTATLVCTLGTDKQLLCKPVEKGEIELTTTNLVVLRGPITAQSASKFVKDFHVLEHKDEVQRIYVYVNSPGGSIFAGDSVTNMVSSSKKEVVMIIEFAASMAFHISQFGTKKLILPTGTMMQHHASGGPNGQQFPNVDKEWSWLKRKVVLMNKKDAAHCVRTGYKQFMKNIDRDWWLLSDEAVKSGCADAVVSKLTCSKDLVSKVDLEEVSFFGMDISIEWSACPLESYPRKITYKSQTSSWDKLTADQLEVVDQYIMLVSDPLQFYNSFGSFGFNKFVSRKASISNETK